VGEKEGERIFNTSKQEQKQLAGEHWGVISSAGAQTDFEGKNLKHRREQQNEGAGQ